MNTPEHTDLLELIEYDHQNVVKKDLIRTGWSNAVLVCLEKGQDIPPHYEPYSVLFSVIEGEGVITVGTEQFDVRQNHLVFVQHDEVRGIAPSTRMCLLGIQEPHHSSGE